MPDTHTPTPQTLNPCPPRTRRPRSLHAGWGCGTRRRRTGP